MKVNLNELDDTLVDIFALWSLMVNKYFSLYVDDELHRKKIPKYDMVNLCWVARGDEFEDKVGVVTYTSIFNKVRSAFRILDAAKRQFAERPVDFTTLNSDDGLKNAIDKAMENWHD